MRNALSMLALSASFSPSDRSLVRERRRERGREKEGRRERKKKREM
jgi:hypothetical protein